MRVFGRLILACWAVSAVVVVGQTPAADAAAAVLAQAREALGGEKKLAAVKTMVATGRTRQVRGENLVPIEFEIAMELPDKYVRKDEIPAQESEPTTVGFNGAELIQLPVPTIPPPRQGGPPGPTAAQMDAARATRLANVRQDFARLALGLFATSFGNYPLTFTFGGKAEAPQGKADVLDVKGPAGFAARLFVNADTHLPIMITWTAPVPQRGMPRGGPPPGATGAGAPAVGAPPASGRGEPAPAAGQPPARGGSAPGAAAQPPARGESAPASAGPPAAAGQAAGPGRGAPTPPPESRLYFADYRDVNGMQFPFRLRRALGQDTVEETTFDGFKINGKIDPKKFEVRK